MRPVSGVRRPESQWIQNVSERVRSLVAPEPPVLKRPRGGQHRSSSISQLLFGRRSAARLGVPIPMGPPKSAAGLQTQDAFKRPSVKKTEDLGVHRARRVVTSCRSASEKISEARAFASVLNWRGVSPCQEVKV